VTYLQESGCLQASVLERLVLLLLVVVAADDQRSILCGTHSNKKLFRVTAAGQDISYVDGTL
jgi:hypothetical protein